MKSLGQIQYRAAAGILAVLLSAAASLGQTSKAPEAPFQLRVTAGADNPQKVRLPAVAGLFYPKDPKALAGAVDAYLRAAKTQKVGKVRALICPHAGYEFSGPAAACGYKLLAGAKYDTVIILAPSHYALFRGASVPKVAAYETPLGRVPISPKGRRLATRSGFVSEPHCLVQRPAWSRMASKPEGDAADDTPDTWEHSAEVQVPFLQRTLTNFLLLPIIFGEVDPQEVANALAPELDEETLIVASSDLSHYHPYEEARTLDRRTVGWIRDMDTSALRADGASESACGRNPILTLLYLAKLKGWKPQVLDYRNSGDTAGGKDRVVGYAAIAFFDKDAPAPSPAKAADAAAEFSLADRKFLLDLSRRTLRSATSSGELPEVRTDSVPAACRVPRGCFVTLTRAGQLRGCIGNILPAGPLFQAIEENTRGAALRDFRFRPVTAQEVADLHIEISVLSVLEPLPFDSPEELLAKLRPKQDGVVLRIGNASATYLPQVWEQLPDKVAFLDHLAEKAGCLPSAWRGKDVSVSRYHVEAFEESK